MADSPKVMVIGWDCAPPREVFETWRADLPNLDRLMREGAWGRLRSTDPPITVPAWTSMLSSKNPGQLGFFGFRNRRVGQYTGKWIATSLSVKVDRVWDILSRQGKRCCVVNVPQTFPVKPLNGAMISCFLTPGTDSDYTYPAELKPEVEAAAGGYVIDVDNFRTDDKDWLLGSIHEMTQKRFKVAKHLLGKPEPWDFFMMVEMGPDRIQHGFWKYTDPEHRKYEPGNPYESCLLDYYKVLDQQLGELCEMAGPETTVLVVSDHGAKRMEGSFNVNDWLMQEGYLTLKRPMEGVTRFDEKQVDWSKTVAWGWGGYYARIFMNVAGREPLGVVAPGEYAGVRDELIRKLEAIQDDRGRVMDTHALTPEELYTGPLTHEASDLLVYFDDLYWRAGQDVGHAGLHSFDTEIGPDDCVHDYDGIFVMRGPGGAHGELLTRKGLDVAPTVLAALGVDVPADFEGDAVVGG
jgi:predicted AlkP superfamily phosphohydrolase/phosphomutase